MRICLFLLLTTLLPGLGQAQEQLIGLVEIPTPHGPVNLGTPGQAIGPLTFLQSRTTTPVLRSPFATGISLNFRNTAMRRSPLRYTAWQTIQRADPGSGFAGSMVGIQNLGGSTRRMRGGIVTFTNY